MQGSSIATSATASDGGNIQVAAGRMLHLDHSAITTSVQGGAGNGGNISIDPHYVLLDNSRIVAQAVGGNGGNIHIAAGTFIQDPASLISASSALGIDGDVTVDAPNTDVSGAMAVLPSAFLSEVTLAGNCASRTSKNSSSLVFARSDTPLPGEDVEFLAQLPATDVCPIHSDTIKPGDRP
jgi:large exoprotein involved in heme utilization and adhesion